MSLEPVLRDPREVVSGSKECSLNSQHQRPRVKRRVSETPFSHLQNEDRTRSVRAGDVTHKACPFGSASGSASGQILGVCLSHDPDEPRTRGQGTEALCGPAHPQAEQCRNSEHQRTFSDGKGGREEECCNKPHSRHQPRLWRQLLH